MFFPNYELPPAVIALAESLPFAAKRVITSMALPRAIDERRMKIDTYSETLANLRRAKAPKKRIAEQKRRLMQAQEPANLHDINRYVDNDVAIDMAAEFFGQHKAVAHFIDMEAWCNQGKEELLRGPLPSERYEGAARLLAAHIGNEVGDMPEEQALRQHLTLRDAMRIRCAHMLTNAAGSEALLQERERESFQAQPNAVFERVVDRMLLQMNLCSYQQLRLTLQDVLAAVFRERLLRAFGLQPGDSRNTDIDNL